MPYLCSNCKLAQDLISRKCRRCRHALANRGLAQTVKRRGQSFLTRAAICFAVCIAVLIGFYVSLIASAAKPDIEQKAAIRRAVALLAAKGFDREAFLLKYATTFRSEDNWL